MDETAVPASRGQPATPRVGEIVAAQLRLRILDGELADGDELPPEAVLVRKYGVSRPSLREAVRILETEGLVTVRRGKVGGTVVRSPVPRTAAYHMGLLLQSHQTPLFDLATARDLLAPFCAQEAALRDDNQVIGARLQQLIAEAAEVIEDGPAFTAAAMAFHRALVEAAGNQTLRIFAGMLESVWSVQERRWARRAAEESRYPSVELRRKVLQSHDAMARAITAGDAELTGRLAREHLRASQVYVASGNVPTVRIVDAGGMPRMGHVPERGPSA
jgi:GntR family transcriptional regulator, transcriptional repressor for pyruvate dehydrogenase complex